MLYKYLDYPKLPIELEAMCLDFDNLEPNLKWPVVSNIDQISVDYPRKNFAQYKQYLPPKQLISWLNDQEIVNKNVWQARIHCMFDGDRIYPHMDYPRIFAINYILTDSTATTCFYKHKLNPDIRPSKTNEAISLNDIELTDSVILEHHRWHYIDVTKIHNVENITVPRIAITVSGFGPA